MFGVHLCFEFDRLRSYRASRKIPQTTTPRCLLTSSVCLRLLGVGFQRGCADSPAVHSALFIGYLTAMGDQSLG